MLAPAISQSFYYNQTLYKTDTLKSSMDTCEVLNVTANYDLGKIIDSSYLVGGIRTVQVKIKSVIVPFKK